MSEQLPVQITALAAQQTREAEVWWRLNRTAAPKQFGKNLERAFALIASQPHVGGRAINVKLPDVPESTCRASSTTSTTTSLVRRNTSKS